MKNIESICKYKTVINVMKNNGHRIFSFDISSEYEKIHTDIENSIKENHIKDSVVIIEDNEYRDIANYISEKYNFKIIYDLNEVNYEYATNVIKKIHKLVSIVVLTFNNIEYTKKCINSILKKTAYPNYELIIVDNNSKDETKKYLIELKNQYSNINTILNEENFGFAKGNNIGIKAAKGEYIILLNNDTVVTRGWITSFIKHLEKNEKLGLIGPVTNYAANEARINTNYKDDMGMELFAKEYAQMNFNKLYTNVNVLIMFCIAMRKNIFEEVGYLDENFGLGMFEDDDFSYRVKKAGYDIAVAEDVFIHHYGSVSFYQINKREISSILSKNRKLFEDKWNVKWIPHKNKR